MSRIRYISVAGESANERAVFGGERDSAKRALLDSIALVQKYPSQAMITSCNAHGAAEFAPGEKYEIE